MCHCAWQVRTIQVDPRHDHSFGVELLLDLIIANLFILLVVSRLWDGAVRSIHGLPVDAAAGAHGAALRVLLVEMRTSDAASEAFADFLGRYLVAKNAAPPLQLLLDVVPIIATSLRYACMLSDMHIECNRHLFSANHYLPYIKKLRSSVPWLCTGAAWLCTGAAAQGGPTKHMSPWQ